jgi:ribosomal protein L24E
MPAPPAPPATQVAVQDAGQGASAYSDDGALLRFKSHINGKNADVAIYPDRVEWVMARGVSGGKITAGILTGGASMLVTGVRNGKAGSEMIPMKSITGVSTKRDGMINTIVTVTSSSAAIGFRVSHKEAEQMRQLLNQLILA